MILLIKFVNFCTFSSLPSFCDSTTRELVDFDVTERSALERQGFQKGTKTFKIWETPTLRISEIAAKGKLSNNALRKRITDKPMKHYLLVSEVRLDREMFVYKIAGIY